MRAGQSIKEAKGLIRVCVENVLRDFVPLLSFLKQDIQFNFDCTCVLRRDGCYLHLLEKLNLRVIVNQILNGTTQIFIH